MANKNKRNPKGSGTIRKRKDGRWEGKYTLGTDAKTGKQIRKSVYGKTETEVAAKLRKITAEIDSGEFITPSNMTLAAWLDLWLNEYCIGIKQRTQVLYSQYANSYLKPYLGPVKLSALTIPMLQRMINGLQKGENEVKPLSAKSIRNIHGVLHKALQVAVEHRCIRENPSSACILPRIERPPIKVMEGKEIAKFLKTIRGHQYEKVFIVDIFTGMRQGELLGLTWDCVDFERGTLFLYRQLQLFGGKYEFTSLKNNKTRVIAPAGFVMRVLREQKALQHDWKALAGTAWHEGDFVFTNQIGEHLKRQTLYKQYKDVVKSIGLSDMRFHDLRHTYAVSALQSGDDVKTVQENLGHHTAAFTLDVYGHVTNQMRQESAKRMDAFIDTLQNF